MLIITGQELGLSPAQSLRGIYVVSGKPVLSADLMVAVVRRSGLCDSWRVVESTAERCTITTRRKGEAHESTRTWTLADAKRAGVTGKSVWSAFPAAMLRHRCAADLARQEYPDVLMGLYDPEEIGAEPEVDDAPERVDVTRESFAALDASAQAVRALAAPEPEGVTVADVEVQVCRCGTVADLVDLWMALRDEVRGWSKSDQTRAWKLVGQRAEAIGSSAGAVSAEVKRLDAQPPPDGPRGGSPAPTAPESTEAHGSAVDGTQGAAPVASHPEAWRMTRDGITAHVATIGNIPRLANSARKHLAAIAEPLRTHAVHAYAGRLQRLSHDGASTMTHEACIERAETWLREGPKVADLPKRPADRAQLAAGGTR